jgi:F-type H+-transporting ATPase subunit epsilon
MYLEIVTPEASVVSGEVESVTVPGVEGPFQMLNNHAAIVSLLAPGKVKFRGNPVIAAGFEKRFSKDADGKWVVEINGGTVECNDNKIIVLAD